MAEMTRLQKYTGTPEDQANATTMYLQGLQGLPVGVASHFIPPVVGDAPASDWKSWIPGIGSYAYQQLGGLADVAVNAFNKSAMYDVTGSTKDAPVFKTPGEDTAGQMNIDAVNTALKVLPHVEPTNEAGKVGQDIGIGMGQGASAVLPGVVAAKLPTVVRSVAGVALPPASTAGVGATLGGTAGAFASPTGSNDVTPPLDTTTQPTSAAPPAPTTTNVKLAPPSEFAPITPPAPTSEFAPLPATPSLRPGVAVPPGVDAPPADGDTSIPYLKYGIGMAAGAALLWGMAKGGPRTLNTISDFVRGQTRDVTEANAALRSGVPPGLNDKPIEMPLPNDAGGMTRQWATNAYNPNAVGNEYAKGVAGSTAEADAMIANNEMINNPANSNRRMEALFRTGVEDGTAHTFPKIVDYKAAADALTPGQQELASYAAWYKSELNLRNQNIKEAASKGVMWTPATDDQYRVSYPDMSTDNLHAAVTLAEQDPQIVDFLNKNKQIQSSLIDSMELRGQITPQQAEYARTNYSDFMPTIDANGKYLQSWDGKMRDVASGYNTPPVPAWEAMTGHFDRTIRGAQMNDWQRNIVLSRAAQQAADPTLAEIVTERPAGSALRRGITINTADGERHFDINNSAFHRWLTGGPQQMSSNLAVANWVRRGYQDLTTGPLAAAFGHPFALKNFIRDAMLIPGQAAPGLWRGEFDRALGTRLPYDPTFIIGSGTTAMKDSTTVVAKNMADILGNRENFIAAPLRKLFGDDQVDTWVDWMRNRIELTKLAQREAAGVGAGGNRATVDMNSAIMDKAGTYRDPTSNAVAPLLNKPNFMKIPERVPLPNFLRNTINGVTRGAAESYINLNTMARELYGAISDAPHSYLHDLNVDNPKFTPRVLASKVQDVTGNPGTRGLGKRTGQAAQTIPYYNTSLQAIGRSLAAFRDNPISSGVTAATIMGTLALAQHLSALVSGPDHVNHMENQLSNSVKARNAVIYHGPGTDPNEHTEIPIPNEWQGIFPFVSGLLGHAVGSWTAHSGDADNLSRIIHTLAGVFDSHVSTSTERQQGIGVVSQFVPGDISPIAGATVGALTGQTVKNVPDQLVSNAISGNPLLSNMTTGGGPTHNTPGQEGSDNMLTRSGSATLKAIVSSLGAATGTAYDLATNYINRLRAGKDWADEGLWRDYKQEWKDNTQFGNFVWKNNMPQSSFGSLEERTSQMWRPVAAAANVNSDIRGEGFTKSTRGTPLTMTGESPVPKDPQMRDMYMTMAATGKVISRDIMPRENTIRAQMDNLKSGITMPEEKRRIQNQLSQQLYDLTTKKFQLLQDLNARLSVKAGGRHVDVGSNINWGGTVDQFHY